MMETVPVLSGLTIAIVCLVIGYIYGHSRGNATNIEQLMGWLERSGVDIGRVYKELEADWERRCEEREKEQHARHTRT